MAAAIIVSFVDNFEGPGTGAAVGFAGGEPLKALKMPGITFVKAFSVSEGSAI